MQKANMQDQVVLITGGSKGYGAGMAQVLSQRGAHVWITGRDEAALKATAQELDIHFIRADVTSGADWDRVFESILTEHGRLDVLINNAGTVTAVRPIDQQSDSEIEQSIMINLTGSLLGCRRAAAAMKEQGAGLIINVSSACQKYAWPGWSVYSAAKAGLAQASKCLYAELREHGVRITTLVPSWGATEFVQQTEDLAEAPPRQPDVRAKCTQPQELGEIVAHICETPTHLDILDYTVFPLVQEIMPM